MKNHYLRLLLLGFCLFLLSPSLSLAQNKAELDSLAVLIQETFEVPGLAIGIVLDNELYYANPLGVQDINSQDPLTTSSLFHMASVSKPFVATAIMQLVEAGKLKLEDKLIDHLPYFRMRDKNYQKITLKQILNHSSGIPDVEDYEWDKPQLDEGAAERYVKSFGETELDFKPGKEFSYSNASFDILADVIAKASGMSFEEYMRKNIFEPAGMKNSTFYKPEVPEKIATSPHGMGDDLQMEKLRIYPYNRIHAPSSTLHSNIEDMSRWALIYLNKGSIDGKQIFSEASYDLLTKKTRKLSKTRDVCLSWFTTEREGQRIYYHTGGDDGYRTFFGFFPEKKAAIILMANNEGFQSSRTATHLAKQLISNQPESWKKYIHVELKNRILTEGIEGCKSFYYHAKENLADQYEFGGGYMDDLGYWLLDRNKQQEALDIFLFNVELYPEEAGFYDSVGDAYIAMENKAKGIEWYEKALKLNPKQDFTIKKLKKLQN